MEDKDKDTARYEELRETFADKTNRVVKDWIIDISIVAMLIVYVFKSVVTIEVSTKGILAILGDCALMLVFLVTIKSLMMRKGIMMGEKSKAYIDAYNTHQKWLQIALAKSRYLSDYITMYNERERKTTLISILSRYGIGYNEYLQGIDSPTEFQQKAFKEISKLKFDELSVNDVTGAGLSKMSQRGLGKTVNEFMTNKNILDIAVTLTSVTVFAVFTVKLVGDFSWANLIWSCLQVVTFLLKGASSFVGAYMFMTGEYVNRIIRQTNILIEFDSMDTAVFETCRQEKRVFNIESATSEKDDTDKSSETKEPITEEIKTIMEEKKNERNG